MIYQAKQHNNKLWFCTFTINDEHMKKDHQRKLKDTYKETNYIINVDYGTKTNRKHYHGIIESKKKPISWNYGFCDFREIKIENINNIAMYINKITNHTLKETTKRERIIYSRIKGE